MQECSLLLYGARKSDPKMWKEKIWNQDTSHPQIGNKLISMLANVSSHLLANMNRALAAHINRALTLWFAFSLCVMNCFL